MRSGADPYERIRFGRAGALRVRKTGFWGNFLAHSPGITLQTPSIYCMEHTERNTGPERWRSKRDLADYYGYSVRWVESMLAQGLPSVRIGGQRRFRFSETDEWLLNRAEAEGHEATA
jgi:hypothetical protein